MRGSVNSIETFGLLDGPGIRTVVFLNSCKLRCKYCHNPEMWQMGLQNMTSDEVVQKVLRSKPYYGEIGGVTFSGGEPLLQLDFILEIAQKLKKENISVALDTAGVGNGNYEKLLPYIDLIILDIKHLEKEAYADLVGYDISSFLEFVSVCQKYQKKLWIRQVIVPGIHDNVSYLNLFVSYVKKLKYVDRIEFLPYHKLGKEKYEKLGIPYPYQNKEEMTQDRCQELYQKYVLGNHLFEKNNL